VHFSRLTCVVAAGASGWLQHTHTHTHTHTGVGGAEKGTLSFMVGASPADFERAKPVLKHMGCVEPHL
jgi:6-phosphogluconate dehydrogenase (decarboxylating)